MFGQKGGSWVIGILLSFNLTFPYARSFPLLCVIAILGAPALRKHGRIRVLIGIQLVSDHFD
jgi:hypothetical protein